MIDEEDHKESEYIGPYLRCPQYKVLPYNLQGIGKFMGEPVGLKDHNSSYSENGVVPDVSLSSNFYATPNGGYSRPVYPQEFSMWSTFYPNFHKVLQSPLFPFEPQLCSFMHPAENQYQYVPLQMFSQGFTHDFPSQEFQYFVVIDFEATCDKEKIPHPQEIIEFPSVLVNGMTGQVEDFFQSYVRPAVHQHLSDFCKELTGIQQNQVDRGVALKEALSSHDKWLEERGIKNKNFAVVTWSNWDCRVMLDSECRFKGLDKPQYFNKWINLKVPFQEVFGGVRCNLKEAVQLAGLAWEGRAHCGLDDARNTARLLIHLMHLGFRFSITNSLPWQSADHPLSHQLSPNILLNTSHNSYKPKQPSAPQWLLTNLKERQIYCNCGVKSCKRMIRKPGPKQGSFFFGCGNWTARRGARCTYFEWASH